MKDPVKTDTTRWKLKVRDLQAIRLTTLPKVLDWAHDKVMDDIKVYVSGPHYKYGERGPGTGGVPIPRVSGNLARSIKSLWVSPLLVKIWSDGRIAPWNQYVHDGTKYMRPRPFIKEPVQRNRPVINMYWRNEILGEIRKIGRSR